MNPNERFLVPTTVSLWEAEKVNGLSPYVWFPPWSTEEKVWWRGSAFLVTLSVIYLEFCSDTPSYLFCAYWDYLFFNRTMTQYTSRLCKGYLTKKESDRVLHQMTWPPQSSNLNPIEIVWGELNCRVKEKQPTSAQHMWDLRQDCWKSILGEAGWENALEWVGVQTFDWYCKLGSMFTKHLKVRVFN